jgi:hypothetical protein
MRPSPFSNGGLTQITTMSWGPARLHARPDGEVRPMLDLLYLAVAVGFFALAIAYAYACERM